MKISGSLKENINILRDIFKYDDSLIFREFSVTSIDTRECTAVYIDGMADSYVINSDIIKPLLQLNRNDTTSYEYFLSLIINRITSSKVKTTKEFDTITDSILNGYTVILADGYESAVLIDTLKIKRRNISEPESEKIIRGPREGFNESLLNDLALLRTRLRSDKAKFHFREIGRITKTKVCLCYI